jgi:hypothetical protein
LDARPKKGQGKRVQSFVLIHNVLVWIRMCRNKRNTPHRPSHRSRTRRYVLLPNLSSHLCIHGAAQKSETINLTQHTQHTAQHASTPSPPPSRSPPPTRNPRQQYHPSLRQKSSLTRSPPSQKKPPSLSSTTSSIHGAVWTSGSPRLLPPHHHHHPILTPSNPLRQVRYPHFTHSSTRQQRCKKQ